MPCGSRTKDYGMVDLAASRILKFWISNIMHLNQARHDINNTAIFAYGTSLCSRMQRMCGQRCFKLEMVNARSRLDETAIGRKSYQRVRQKRSGGWSRPADQTPG